jgi:hypothetical protein
VTLVSILCLTPTRDSLMIEVLARVILILMSLPLILLLLSSLWAELTGQR